MTHRHRPHMLAPLPAAAAMLAAAIWVQAPANAAADDAQGAFIAATCATCHHAPAENAAIPVIAGAGWDRARLQETMIAFRTGARTDALMHAVATSLTDAELDAVIGYLAATSSTP